MKNSHVMHIFLCMAFLLPNYVSCEQPIIVNQPTSTQTQVKKPSTWTKTKIFFTSVAGAAVLVLLGWGGHKAWTSRDQGEKQIQQPQSEQVPQITQQVEENTIDYTKELKDLQDGLDSYVQKKKMIGLKKFPVNIETGVNARVGGESALLWAIRLNVPLPLIQKMLDLGADKDINAKSPVTRESLLEYINTSYKDAEGTRKTYLDNVRDKLKEASAKNAQAQ